MPPPACALRPGEGERDSAVDVAGEPLEPVEPDAVVGAPRRGLGGADVAAALLLGDPGAAGHRLAVRTHKPGQVGIPHRLRRETIEHVGDRAGQSHRAVDRDVGLREQIAHREGQRVGAPLRAVVEPDDAPLVDLAVSRRVERIVADNRTGEAVLIQGFEDRRREAVGVVGLLVDGGRDPAAEAAQPLGVVVGEPGRAALQEGLKIPVRPVDVAAESAVPVRHGCATFWNAGSACAGIVCNVTLNSIRVDMRGAAHAMPLRGMRRVMARLAGKVAIVTGATSGLGAASAVRMAEEGAAVLVTGRDEGRGAEVVSSITRRAARPGFSPST